MSSAATVPMMPANGGDIYDVPQENMQQALADGHKLAVPMMSADGSQHAYVPHDKVVDAQKNDKWQVDTKASETPTLADTIKKSFGIGNLASNAVQGLKELAGGVGQVAFGDPLDTVRGAVEGSVDQAQKASQDFDKKDVKGKVSGAGHALAAALPGVGPFAAGLGEQAGKGDVGGAAARGGAQVVAGTAATKAAGAAADVVRTGGTPALLMSADELAGTTPKRLSELKTVPEKMAAVHKLAVDTEASAKAAAKAAYPDVKTPVIRTRVEKFEDPNPLSPGAEGAPVPSAHNVVQEKVPFAQVQEEYSRVGKQIADEKRAVARGSAPAYDLKALSEKFNTLGEEMRTAAAAAGKLPQFNAAQAKFRQYMEDFHNRNSAVRPLLETTADQTAKISNHLLSADKGARTMQVLRKYGADTSGVEKVLSRGATPLKVDVTESSKLTKAGSDSNYRTQRLNEALDQATTNRLPSGSEAKIPAKAMSSKAPAPLDLVPGGKLLAPRNVTKVKLSRALRDTLSGKP